MRIAQLLSVGITNGAARYCLELTAELARRGHELVLVHRRWLDVGEVEAAGVKCVEFEYERTPANFRRLLALLADHGTEVVHTHMSAAHAYGVVLRFLGGPPVVATAHAKHVQLHWAFNDAVIAPSEATARYHRRLNLVPRRRMTVVPSFLGAQWFDPPTEAERWSARERLGVTPDDVVVGQVADIHFMKRQSDLILAMRRLLERRPRLVVALMGAQWDPAEMKRVRAAMTGIEDRMRLVDRNDDVAGFLHGLDIFAVSSISEEGPFAALEAMSTGLPIVSTRVGRMREMLEEGRSGLICEPRDIAGLANALDVLCGDPGMRRSMGGAARARAVAEHATTTALDAIETVLVTTAGRGRR